jgi:hypothetical protein
MIGVGLGRLWDTHPRIAFVLHLLLTLYLGVLATSLFVRGATGGGIALSVVFAIMAASIVLFAWLEAQNGWRSEDTSYDGSGQVVGPRTAWANTAARGRFLWVLFLIVFVTGLVLTLGRSIAGAPSLVLALGIAIFAMRAD